MQICKDRKKAIESLSQDQVKKITNEMKGIIRGKITNVSSTNSVFQEFIDVAIVLSKDKFFKNKNINNVTSALLDLIENKKIYFGISDHVPNVIVAIVPQKDGNPYLTIMAPSNWPSLLRDDPDYQMGTVVYISSHCKDFANGIDLKEESEKSQNRAMSYEVELINYLKEKKKEIKLNEYQEEICKKFPNGHSSCDCHY
ncbi:MAG: hypothetical protein EKK64_08575 [Neisseriaceae bacterium]|nr:MAG: hypothetical protein EKK64_08575 [Neisseriaceae bacterium]